MPGVCLCRSSASSTQTWAEVWRRGEPGGSDSQQEGDAEEEQQGHSPQWTCMALRPRGFWDGDAEKEREIGGDSEGERQLFVNQIAI